MFRGASSPSCSNFALRKTASDNRDENASDVIKILERNFYVDDKLKIFQTVTKDKICYQKGQIIVRRGSF